jgi:hypothetical protein
VLGLDCFLILMVAVISGVPLTAVEGVLAYVGPGAGLELIPYSMGLLTWIGVAFGAVALWPLSALRRRIRRTR